MRSKVYIHLRDAVANDFNININISIRKNGHSTSHIYSETTAH